MNAFTRLEAVCANVVERTFAVAFPSALQPVMIARKLVAAFESAAAGEPREGRRFLVQLAPADVARFAPDREYLERQWSTMLARLAERSGGGRRARRKLGWLRLRRSRPAPSRSRPKRLRRR